MRLRLWLRLLAAVALTIGLIIAWQRPWVPELEAVRVAAGISSVGSYDRTIVEHLSIIAGEESLRPALRARPRVLEIDRPIYFDRCEVTFGEYQGFNRWYTLDRPSDLRVLGQSTEYSFESRAAKDPFFSAPDRPVSGVTFYDAAAYCQSAGGRLPTTEEWQAAAAGTAGRLYPWGDEPIHRPWRIRTPADQQKLVCGLYNETRSPPLTPAKPDSVVFDLGTNVSEWTRGSYGDSSGGGLPAIAGGNQYHVGWRLLALNAIFVSLDPNSHDPLTGFRCVYDEPEIVTPWNTRPKVSELAPGLYQIGPPRESRIGELIRSIEDDQLSRLPELFSEAKVQHDREFWIGREEVSRADYQVFLWDPLVRLGVFADASEPRSNSYVPDDWSLQRLSPEAPVTGVDYWDAQAFANWVGGRLPRAKEWAWAAGLGAGLVYPWGWHFETGVTGTLEAEMKGAVAPGTFPFDKAWSGAMDMGGNVSEWTQTPFTNVIDQDTLVIVKGGNYSIDGLSWSLVNAEIPVARYFKSPAIGIRLAWDEAPKPVRPLSSGSGS